MNKQLLTDVHSLISPYIHRTPILTSRLLNDMAGAELYFKCENMQKMGAFKMRGAAYAILALTDEQRAKGVVAHSSGNFAQAVALSAQMMGVKAYIVMPNNAPQVKKDAVEAYGGIITLCEPTIEAREYESQKISNATGASPLHPSNQDEVIYGNSSLAIEMIEEVPDLEQIIVPIGGGGMIAGVALAAHHFSNGCEVIGAEPAEADDAYRSLTSGQIEKNDTANTIADGLRTHLGDRNFPIIQKHVSQIVTVTEDEIISGMKIIWERLKVVIEPSAGVGVAVALKEQELVKGKKVGVVLCGGNVDLTKLPW